MDFVRRLGGFEGERAIEVAHLLYRYLTHRLDDASFRKLFLADPSTRGGEQSFDDALAVIRDIESSEGAAVRSLPSGALLSYLDQLAAATRGLEITEMDPRLRAQAERELLILRAM